ncbi:MAG: amino acid--tRNA ligase-related protein, partial [Candidatus Gracilibacteria bacterium]
FIFRSNLLKALREFYWQQGFTEIETPVLESVSSGAAAKPFITHHNALDIDMYLRIAAGELWQKMAIVGGFEKTFEVARCFRNEGMDPSHLQEFTMIEHYAAYWDFEDNMKFTEKMFEYMLQKLIGTTKVMVKDREGNEVEVDFKTPWPRKRYTDLIKEDSGIDVLEHDNAETLLKEIRKNHIQIDDAESLGYGNLVDALYKKVTRPKLIQPTFVIQHPLLTKPLARKNDKDSRLCDTFQLLVNSWEIVNAYSELVDPVDQRERFEAQSKAKAEGDEEAMMINEEYLVAMEHGMPCMSGWGMGIDRLVTLLTRQDNVKDCVLFPLMRPLEEYTKKQEKLMEKFAKKSSKAKKKLNG